MTDRKRDPLPAGYQFGDAKWQRPSQNAAAWLQRRATDKHFTANVIEGEHFATDADPGDEKA